VLPCWPRDDDGDEFFEGRKDVCDWRMMREGRETEGDLESREGVWPISWGRGLNCSYHQHTFWAGCSAIVIDCPSV
jgi:hypothetical protein